MVFGIFRHFLRNIFLQLIRSFAGAPLTQLTDAMNVMMGRSSSIFGEANAMPRFFFQRLWFPEDAVKIMHA